MRWVSYCISRRLKKTPQSVEKYITEHYETKANDQSSILRDRVYLEIAPELAGLRPHSRVVSVCFARFWI